MAYDNFIPEIWEEKIEHDLEKLCVFAEDTNRKYEGKVKKCGDTVHILTSGKPTIRTLARSAADGDRFYIADPGRRFFRRYPGYSEPIHRPPDPGDHR